MRKGIIGSQEKSLFSPALSRPGQNRIIIISIHVIYIFNFFYPPTRPVRIRVFILTFYFTFQLSS